MQSVTSNAVAKANSFYTTEVFTGKYFTNGKKIYKKTLPPTTVQLVPRNWGFCGYPSTIMSDMETVTSVTAITTYHGKLQYLIPDVLVIPEIGFFTITADLYVGSSITLEYTKVTN